MGVRNLGCRALLGAMAFLLLSAPAQAAWVRAETDKFIVYGEGSEKSVRDFATKLTTFDWVLRNFHPSTQGRKPGTKVQVFLLSSLGDLQRIRPAKYAQGFYSATNEGVFAFVVKSEDLGTDDVLFHEYGHHFMLENFPVAYPAWFVEGWAEYFMTTEIAKGLIKIGKYNPARVDTIFNERWLPMPELLAKTTGETRRERINAYYAQAWLLTHYMRSDETRARQLNVAISAIADGKDPVKSMEMATGAPLAELTASLKTYRKLPIIGIRNPGLTPEMKVTVMPRSADDLLIDEMRLILSDIGEVDQGFLASVRRKAARYPGDRFAEQTLARAEFVMGDVAAGEAIMKRRLDAGPDDAEDLLLAGTGQVMAGMRDRDTRDARYRAARPLLTKAYQLDKDDYRTLIAYARSRSIEPTFPNDNDLAALAAARYLAPAVEETSFHYGVALLQKGQRDAAAKVLAPVINNPHGGRAGAQARMLLNQGRIGTVDFELPEGDEEEAPAPSGTPATPAR